MKSDPGTYALILKSVSTKTIQVGRWGKLTLQPGYYVYIGSAFGPGGVQARVSRHLREIKVKHWHIDYLREYIHPKAVWYSYGPEHLEHLWARALSDGNEFVPIQGFGCSDCKCFSHLFHTSRVPKFDSFTRVVSGTLEVWEF